MLRVFTAVTLVTLGLIPLSGTQFTRYRKDDTPIASYESLYVVTKEQGRWAIKMRSSFVP